MGVPSITYHGIPPILPDESGRRVLFGKGRAVCVLRICSISALSAMAASSGTRGSNWFFPATSSPSLQAHTCVNGTPVSIQANIVRTCPIIAALRSEWVWSKQRAASSPPRHWNNEPSAFRIEHQNQADLYRGF